MFTPKKEDKEKGEQPKYQNLQASHRQTQDFTFVKNNKGRLEFPTLYKQKEGRDKNHYQGVVLLRTEDNELLRFRVFLDKDLGIPERVQEFIHETKNDDDRQTTSTQLDRSGDYTFQDLKKGIILNNPDSTLSQMLECLSGNDSLTSTPSK